MAPTLESLGIDKLSLEERLSLAQAIWDSCEEEVEDVPLTEAWEQELDCRIADHEANPDAVIPWEQIKAEALARFKKS